MKKITYLHRKNARCTRDVIDHYSQQSGGRPPEDFVLFCLTDNGGELAPDLCDYRVPKRFPCKPFSVKRVVDAQILIGMGPMEDASIYSVEGQEETVMFLGLSPSEYWVIAHGGCNDGYLLGVADNNRGHVFYCYFDDGTMYPVAASFTEFINGLGTAK